MGFELPVDAISIKEGSTHLLEKWLDTEILPLYDRHAELARQSLNRKIGALRLGVETALKTRLKRSGAGGQSGARIDTNKLRDLETELRTAAGKIAQARTGCLDMTDALRECADGIIRTAANNLIEAWDSGASRTGDDLVKNKLEQAAAGGAAQIVSAIQDVARNAGSVLAKAAVELDIENRPEQDELLDVLKNMPRFDLGSLEIEGRPECGGLAVWPPMGDRTRGAADQVSSWRADCGRRRDLCARAPGLGAQDVHRFAGAVRQLRRRVPRAPGPPGGK